MEKALKHPLYLKKDTIIYRSHYADTADQTIDETLHVICSFCKISHSIGSKKILNLFPQKINACSLQPSDFQVSID